MRTHYTNGSEFAARRLGLEKTALDPLAALGGVSAAGGTALAMPGIRRAVKNFLGTIGKGGALAAEAAQGLPPEAVAQAKELAQHLRSAGFDPKTGRVAIIGTGGTGKTTMGRALSEELGMPHMIMDDVGKSWKGRDLAKYVAENPLPPGLIAEQTHLLTQVDPDQFNSVVYLRKPIEGVVKQMNKRGRGAWQTDLYDYPAIDKALSKGYETLDAPEVQINPTVRMKTRQGESFHADAALDKELLGLGMDPSNMTREQKVISAALGKRVRLGGTLPYYDLKKLGLIGGAGAGGTALAQLLMR